MDSKFFQRQFRDTSFSQFVDGPSSIRFTLYSEIRFIRTKIQLFQRVHKIYTFKNENIENSTLIELLEAIKLINKNMMEKKFLTLFFLLQIMSLPTGVLRLCMPQAVSVSTPSISLTQNRVFCVAAFLNYRS